MSLLNINLRIIYCILAGFFNFFPAGSQPLLKYNQNQTPEWPEVIQMYHELDSIFPEAKLIEAGFSDSGRPIHLFIINKKGEFKPGKDLNVILINNGIHPGESCGIDASIEFASELLYNQKEYRAILDELTICIIPVLNVGGSLNRNPWNRANQNGPELQGFRANALNMDLNRDFIKLDTKNVQSLVSIIRQWDPDIFIDTHTSNGADYPYILTLITTQKDKLAEPVSSWLHGKMVPHLFDDMKNKGFELTPYVQPYKQFPEDGIIAFYDYPRYTTGYASLFAIPGFTTEAHMFKPYKLRVIGTLEFMYSAAEYLALNHIELNHAKKSAREKIANKTDFVIHRELDTTVFNTFRFKGYEKKEVISRVTGLQSYYFDQSSPWEKDIPYYDTYKVTKQIKAPSYYLIPQGWTHVIDRLQWNGVLMEKLDKDSLFFVEYYRIISYDTYPQPYNGHYKHVNTKVQTLRDSILFLKGDYMIPVNQEANNYLVEVLEPESHDSFFNWNFFDSILSRKEYFSSYVFDTLAIRPLENEPVLRKDLEEKKNREPNFAQNHRQQLNYIYENSVYSEESYLRYPVMRYTIPDGE